GGDLDAVARTDIFDQVVEVDGGPRGGRPGLGPGQQQEVVDQPAEPLDVDEDVVPDRCPVPEALRDFQLYSNAGQRAAQLVGGIGDERPLPGARPRQPVDHVVQRSREPMDLVVRHRYRQPLLRVCAGDPLGARPQRLDRAQRGPDDPPGDQHQYEYEQWLGDEQDGPQQADALVEAADRHRDDDRLGTGFHGRHTHRLGLQGAVPRYLDAGALLGRRQLIRVQDRHEQV